MQTTLLLFAAYLIGSIPFAVVVSRLFGMADPRTYGSGNPGATNVLRSGNKLAAVLTLVGDALKGWVVVTAAKALAPLLDLTTTAVAAAGLLVFLGHVFPLFLGFRGGKGVATAIGVLLGANPALGLASIGVWLVIAAFFRYSSLAALCAALASPGLAFLFGLDTSWVLSLSAMSGLLIWRHKDNVKRLLAGTEGRIGKAKT